jgi:methylmalonyl-CoA mutase N-terminal domain/subunit
MVDKPRTDEKAESLEKIEAAKREWEERTLNPTLKRMPERTDEFITTSSVPVDRLYTPRPARLRL